MTFGLGIDAGGTYTKLVAAAGSGKVLRRTRLATEPGRGARSFVARVAGAVGDLERGLGSRAAAACLALAGDVDQSSGGLRRSPNMAGLENFPIRSALSRALERPVAIHNDANMAAWGCYALELGRRYPSVVCVTLGTGVGGGLILDGRLVTGATGSAGEIGHMRVEAGGALCGCGGRGCLEAYAGKSGIMRIAAGVLGSGSYPRSRLNGCGDRLQPRHIASSARRGDPAARETWTRVGRALGAGLINIIYLFNPDAVVFTGGVSKAAPLFMGPVRRALRAETFRAPFGRVKLFVAKNADLGALGAAVYSLEN